MLLPTQQSVGLAASNTMQSMLDGIEEQRKQDDEKRTGRERDKLTEARISASDEARRARDKIASALFGTGSDDPAKMKLDLIERLATKLGIDTQEARSSYKLGKALEDALKDMTPDEVRKLAETIGLVDLGVSMDTLLKAIKNPYGDDNERLRVAFITAANGGKVNTEVERVVQRLESAADPKTIEELKLGPQGYDPTRVEDSQTRAERQQDLQAAEAGAKLEDVQKIQDVIEKQNDAAIEPGNTAGTPVAADADALLTVIAAAAEKVAPAHEADHVSGEPDAVEPEPSSAEAVVKDEAAQSEAHAALASEFIADQATEDANVPILPVRIDEIGLYELLKKKLAA